MSLRRLSARAAFTAVCFVLTPVAALADTTLLEHAFRPRDTAVLHKFADRFPAMKTFTVEDALGGWAKVQADHFADGAIYDQIVVKR